MRICYILLSPTFGMHQYTADLANGRLTAGDEVHLVTTEGYVADRYAPGVTVHTPVALSGTGISFDSFNLSELLRVLSVVRQVDPDMVHITGPHIWNGLVMRWLRRRGIPSIHTLHDVEPHAEGLYGAMVRRWNRSVLAGADHILVHGRRYAGDLVRRGVARESITCAPLLHGCWTHGADVKPAQGDRLERALFFGRLEAYKGIGDLLAAWELYRARVDHTGELVLAGKGDIGDFWPSELPRDVTLIGHHIDDQEAYVLLSTCTLLVLPYRQATQSALVAAAYQLATPVLVTDSGALAEYVEPDVTGWVVPAGDVTALAGAIENALSDPQRLRRMGRAGRSWYDLRRAEERSALDGMYCGMAGQSVRQIWVEGG